MEICMSKTEFELITKEYGMKFDEEIEYMYANKGEYVYSWNGVTIYYGYSSSVRIGGFIPHRVAEVVCEKYPKLLKDVALTSDKKNLCYCMIENVEVFGEFLNQLSNFYEEKERVKVKTKVSRR